MVVHVCMTNSVYRVKLDSTPNYKHIFYKNVQSPLIHKTKKKKKIFFKF
jgi:hypothetical protein